MAASHLAKIYRTAFYMGAWGHDSPKQTKLWSNCFDVCLLHRGFKVKQKAGAKPLVKKYKDKSGKQCVSGTAALKSSQMLEWYCTFMAFPCTVSVGIVPTTKDISTRLCFPDSTSETQASEEQTQVAVGSFEALTALLVFLPTGTWCNSGGTLFRISDCHVSFWGLADWGVRSAKVMSSSPTPQIFKAMEWADVWDDADLRSCIAYARASKSLKLSDDWRAVLPGAI